MSEQLKVLITEDNPNDADLLVLELERGGFQVVSQRVENAQDFQQALEQKEWDMIFSDHSMPHFNSFKALEILNQKKLDVPFIILSGTMGEDLAVQAMKAGANDYFVKGRLARLIPVVNRELQEVKEREARRNIEEELERFVASLTHDLRTPIVAEQRILELLRVGNFGEISPTQHEVIDELIRSNQFLQHMVNNILYAYKYKQHQVHLDKQVADLSQFIGSLAGSLAVQAMFKDRDHQLLIEPSDTIPPVEIDRNEIQRVLLNLLRNAVDYTPSGGVVTISTDWRDDFVRVGVRDTGSGVNSNLEPHLFKAYTTSSTKKFHHVGMGLGLYLSKQIIEAHQGHIGYQKIPEGSLFYFDLPVKK